MKEIEYKPKPTKAADGSEVSSPFSGLVKLRVPTYKERLEIIKKLNYKVGKDGELEAKSTQFDSATEIMDLVEKHVVSVELTLESDVITSLEDLGYYMEGSQLINELANVIIGGIKLGKH